MKDMNLQEWIKHCFVPRTSNNQRARALHPFSLLVYLIVLVLLQTGLQSLHTLKPEVLGYATNITVEELYRITNEKRFEAGLPPLQLNPKLSQAAQMKAADMYNQNYWAHKAPDGTTPWQFILQAGYQYLVAGENLAKNFTDSRSVVEAWMRSPSHRDNILKPEFQDVGFAVVDGKLLGEETTLVVQMFGKAKGSVDRIVYNQPPVVTTTPQPTLFPTQPPLATVATPTPLPSIATYEVAGVRNNPLLDLRSLKRQISIFMLLFLMGVLLIDGYFVYTQRKVRIAGRNWAHIIFILAILGIIYFAQNGSIL